MRDAEIAKPGQQHASKHMHVFGNLFSQHEPGEKHKHGGIYP